MVNSPAKVTKIFIYKDKSKEEIIGYFAVHRFEKLLMQLAEEFGLKKLDQNNPFVRKVGWITQATEEEKVFWQSSKNPHIRFYIDLNPDFDKGNGVLTLMPLTFLNLLISLFSFLIYYTLKRKIRYNLHRLFQSSRK